MIEEPFHRTIPKLVHKKFYLFLEKNLNIIFEGLTVIFFILLTIIIISSMLYLDKLLS